MTPTRRRRPRPASEPDPSARPFPPPTEHSEALVEANLGLARQAAWKWSRKTGQPYDDLEAVAFVGLIRGCRRYDPERINPGTGRPYALSTVACPFITGELLHHFRDRGHAVKFPSRWRENWGKVQRLLNDPAVPAEQVAELAGMTQGELDEMVAAMVGTVDLDTTFSGVGTPPPEISEPDRLAPLQRLVERAWENLHEADRGLLTAWWKRPHRQALPQGPLQQFHARLKALLGGRTLREVLQLALAADVPEMTRAEARAQRLRRERDYLEAHGLVEPGEELRPQRRSRKALEVAAAQLGLLA